MRVVSCAAYFYPAYFFALTLTHWAPVIFGGAEAREVRLTTEFFGPGLPALWPALTCAFTIGACGLAWLALRKWPFAAGLLIACIAHAGLRNAASAVWFSRGRLWWAIGAMAACTALLAAGLRLLRPGPVGAGFLLPLAGALYLWARPHPYLLYFAPALLAAALTPWRKAPPGPGWRVGLAASVALYAAAYSGGAAIGRWRAIQQREARSAAMKGAPPVDAKQPFEKLFFQRGVNLTAEFPEGYRPQSAAVMLDKLRSQGVNSIALVPYGFSPGARSAEIRFRDSMETPEDIEAVAALARQRGMRVLLKPQIWLGRGGFPGDIDMPAPDQRAKWFASYLAFLEFHARLAARIHADLFCVGVELAGMTPYEAEWRALIARAREIYSGPLVYAAIQGREFETLQFWDALDYIGLNNYYPLPDDLSTDAVVRKVEEVQRRFNKPVIFPEAGFSSLKDPHRAPWDETPRDLSPWDQARCYEAVLRAFYKKPWFQGVYWWKVGANGYGGPQDGSHTPWRKPAMDVVARWYTQGGR